MVDFSHMKGSQIKSDSTSEYTIYEIMTGGQHPTLIVKPSTEANRPYYNELLKRMRRISRRVRGGGMDVETVERSRDEDRELFPLHVIEGWKDVYDANDKPVSYSVENCRDFLKVVADWIFDDVRNYCSDPTNFVDEEPDGAVEDTAKN